MKKYNRNSACQKIQTFDTLLTFRTGSGVPRAVVFQVPIPDSRLRVKISVLFVPPSGIAASGLTGSIWIAEADRDESGVSGDLIPLTNVEGTQAAPTAIPSAAGLQGYSREFVSAADFLEATCSFTSGGPSAGGSWVLQCRYQPQSVRFTNEEWEEIANQCNPGVSSGPVID